jgi:hypothetical protein
MTTFTHAHKMPCTVCTETHEEISRATVKPRCGYVWDGHVCSVWRFLHSDRPHTCAEDGASTARTDRSV